MIEQLVQALASAAQLVQLVRSAKSAAERDAGLSELQKALIHAQGVTLSLQNQYASLLMRNDELEKEAVRLKDWTSDRQQYALREIGPGALAYVHQTSVQPTRSAQKLCCNCFDNTIKSTLQMTKEFPRVRLVCPAGCPAMDFEHFL